MPEPARPAGAAGPTCSLPAWQAFAQALYRAAGLSAPRAEAVARLQVLTDAMGRRTHGLAMLPLYLAELAKGGMASQGEIETVKDNGLVAVWDGHYLPGLWLIDEALRLAAARARQHGMAAVAVRRGHHIGCLAALMKATVDSGLVVQISNSDPAGQRVAPYGGSQALFTPNPIAYGYPCRPWPVLVDICASITTTSLTRQKVAQGEQFEHQWLLDAQGAPTRDPRVLEHAQPRGSLQLLGGTQAGHKGFGLALMIEAQSQGLSGHGRADAPQRWGSSTLVQVFDPEAFAGAPAFATQVEHLAQACHANPPIRSDQPVRLPGEQAARLHAQALREGLALEPATWAALAEQAQRLAVPLPAHP